MRSISTVRLLAALTLALGLAACGGSSDGDDDDDTGRTDASTDAAGGAAVDAAPSPDAPAGLTGLGQACVPSMMGADCPANANGCLSTQGASTGYCTKLCVASATFMTNAQSQPGPSTPLPSTQDAMCTAIFSGTTGTAACLVPVNVMPMPPLQPNTNYTAAFACGIRCGAGNTCPGSLTCNMQLMECR